MTVVGNLRNGSQHHCVVTAVRRVKYRERRHSPTLGERLVLSAVRYPGTLWQPKWELGRVTSASPVLQPDEMELESWELESIHVLMHVL